MAGRDGVEGLDSGRSVLRSLATHYPHVTHLTVEGAFVGIGEADVWTLIMDALPLEKLIGGSFFNQRLTDASLRGIAEGFAARRSRLLTTVSPL